MRYFIHSGLLRTNRCISVTSRGKCFAIFRVGDNETGVLPRKTQRVVVLDVKVHHAQTSNLCGTVQVVSVRMDATGVTFMGNTHRL